MSRIKMQSDGKRARFFPESGTDEMMSMMLELMSEVWVLRERMYAIEQVAAQNGLDLPAGVEAWQPSAEQSEQLQDERHGLHRGCHAFAGSQQRAGPAFAPRAGRGSW